MKKEQTFTRMCRFWHIQRLRIERKLEAVGDRVEYSETTRKESTKLNQPYKP